MLLISRHQNMDLSWTLNGGYAAPCCGTLDKPTSGINTDRTLGLVAIYDRLARMRELYP